MHDHDQAIARFRRRVAAVLTLRYSLFLVTGLAFALGLLVLVLRAGLGVSPEPLLWGLLIFPAAIGLAAWLGWRRRPRLAATRALFDHRSRLGGMLMAEEEQDLEAWRPLLPRPVELGVRWRHGRRGLGLLGCGVLFLLVAFLVPARFAAATGPTPLEIGHEVERLAARVELLKEEEILEPERAEAIRERLSQLREEATGLDPAKTLEALDHVANTLNQAAKEAAEAAVRKTEDYSRAEALAEALHQAGASLDAKTLDEGLKELAALMKQSAGQNELDLDDKTLEDALEAGLTPEQLKKLASALRGGKGRLGKMIKKLVDAELIDAEFLAECENAANCDSAPLAAFLKENPGCCLGDALAACNIPGRGGVTRGRGDAEMMFGKGTSEEGVKFKEETLPAAKLSEIKESQLVGASKRAPDVDKPAVSRAGALRGAAAGGGSAQTPVVLPRHRVVVERYFERTK